MNRHLQLVFSSLCFLQESMQGCAKPLTEVNNVQGALVMDVLASLEVFSSRTPCKPVITPVGGCLK